MTAVEGGRPAGGPAESRPALLVLVLSDITRDLSLGDQVRYEDRGVHVLKGIPRPRHVFAVA